MFAFCALTVASGCYCTSVPQRLSLVKARIDTLAPEVIRFKGSNGDCDDCIPYRSYTCDYFPCWDYHITRFSGQCCAYRAFGDYRNDCGRPLSHHFKSGFIAAYEDLALNRRPQPPVVPPSKYWNAFYRSCAGQPCIDDWYAGYDAGLEAGSNCGVSRFQEVYLRRNGCGISSNNRYANGPTFQNEPVPQQPSITPVPEQPVPSQNLPLQNGSGPQPFYGQQPGLYGAPGQYGAAGPYGTPAQFGSPRQ